MQRQEEFAANDLVDGKVLPFTIVLDKGYRTTQSSFHAGGQRVLQPVFAKSDRRFTRDETLRTASVATDRAGNERAVNVCKRSWYIARGLTPNMSPKRMNDAWLTFAFQSNFMYDPVL